MKKTVIIFTIVILSFLKCFAMDIKIDNPYKDLEIHLVTKFHSTKAKEVCKKSKKGKKKCTAEESSRADETIYNLQGYREQEDFVDASAIGVAIRLKGNGQILPTQIYDAQAGIVPLGGPRYEELFILGGQEGKVVYTVEAKFGESNKVIKTLKVKVLEATLAGEEMDKMKKKNKKN